MSALRIVSTIPAKPGWWCVFAAPEGGAPRALAVASWAVVEGAPGSQGPEVCPMVEESAPGRLPELRPIVHGLPSHCPPGYLGLCPPGEEPQAWAARAREAPGE